MTAEGFLDLYGLREHPAYWDLAADLQDEFAAVGEAFLNDRAEKDSLLRAMLNPAYQTWSMEHVEASVLRPGIRIHHRRENDHDISGTITAIRAGDWIEVEFLDGDRRSFPAQDWDAERDVAFLPIPLDAATIAASSPTEPLTA